MITYALLTGVGTWRAQRTNEQLKKDVMVLYTTCTKDDVTLNNYITRSKIFECI